MTASTGKGRGFQKFSPEERFWNKVDKNGPIPPHRSELGQCWIWTGCTSDFGHGTIRIDWKLFRCHRLSFEWAGNKLESNDCVLHHCDNPSCVRPDHLFKGSKRQNTQDMVRKGRHKFVAHYGEAVGNSKLKTSQVHVIRHLYDHGAFNQYELADLYDVSQATIGKIVRREGWSHI